MSKKRLSERFCALTVVDGELVAGLLRIAHVAKLAVVQLDCLLEGAVELVTPQA